MKHSELEAFYRLYYNQIKVYAYSLCKNKDVAEDVAQDTFVKFMRLDVDEGRNVKYLLIKIARNLVFDEYRKSKRNSEFDERFHGESVPMPIDDIITESEYAALYKAMAELDARSREVITLFYFEEMSIKEIAEMTEMSEANVKVVMHRARQALKKMLEV